MNKFVKSGLVAVAGLGVAGAASAAIDTAPLLTAITDSGVAAAAIGTAVLVVVISIKALKYVKTAL